MIDNSKKDLEFSALSKTLEVLNLSHNALHRIPYSLYSVIYPQLKGLSFNHNAISQFERCMLRAWPNISQLYLSNNNIQTFDGLFYNRPWGCPETEATAPLIKHNQLDCAFVDTWVPNISNDRFAKYCIHAVNRLFHVEAIHACECASPPDMKGVSLLSLGKGHWWHHDFLRYWSFVWRGNHYDDVTMNLMASQITSLTVVYSIVYSGVDKKKHQSSASLAFVRGIHRDRWIPRTKGQ